MRPYLSNQAFAQNVYDTTRGESDVCDAECYRHSKRVNKTISEITLPIEEGCPLSIITKKGHGLRGISHTNMYGTL